MQYKLLITVLCEGNRSDPFLLLPAQGEKCEFARANDHFLTQEWSERLRAKWL